MWPDFGPADLFAAVREFRTRDRRFGAIPTPPEGALLPETYDVVRGEERSAVLARSVYLAFGNLDVEVSDNYFNILPGETVEITAKSLGSLVAVKTALKVVSLTDAFAPGAQVTEVAPTAKPRP